MRMKLFDSKATLFLGWLASFTINVSTPGHARAAAYEPLVSPTIELLPESVYATPAGLSPERFTRLDSEWTKGARLLDGFKNLYNAQIFIEEGSDYPYRLYFFGWSVEVCNQHLKKRSGCDSIFYARSKNMSAWEVFTGFDSAGRAQFDRGGRVKSWYPIVQAGDSYWDQWHNGDPSVIKVGSIYFMALSTTGFDIDGTPDGQRGDRDKDFSAIGGAISTDGIRWTKLRLPLLVAKSEIGGLDPAPYGNYHRPTLIYDGDRFKLWFDYWDPANGLSMGYAELPGPATLETFSKQKWVIRQGHDRPAIANWPNPNVIKTPKGYFSYADPVGYGEGWQGRKIAEAYSPDGLQWTIRGYLEPDPGCPANGVPEATLVGEEIWLTTGCQRGGTPYSPDYPAIHIRKRSL